MFGRVEGDGTNERRIRGSFAEQRLVEDGEMSSDHNLRMSREFVRMEHIRDYLRAAF